MCAFNVALNAALSHPERRRSWPNRQNNAYLVGPPKLSTFNNYPHGDSHRSFKGKSYDKAT